MTKLMKLVLSSNDVPEGPHFAVLEFHQVTESSGWGSEHDTQASAPKYYVTDNREAWESHIRACVHDKTKYVAMKVEGKAKIERPVIIT